MRSWHVDLIVYVAKFKLRLKIVTVPTVNIGAKAVKVAKFNLVTIKITFEFC